MRLGIYSDLRNPKQWARSWPTVYGRAIERIQHAEQLGIHEAWFTEHHQFDDGYLPQPLTFAAAVAAATSRISIGTAILLAPLRPAADIAEQAAIVDLVSNGRLQLGLGAGYRPSEYRLFERDIATRFQDLEARARDIRQAWDEGLVTPPPAQKRVPIWIGAMGPRTARMTGRLGEGLLYIDPPIVDIYLDALEEAGHPREVGRVAGVANLILSDDPERAWSRIAPHLEHMWETYRTAAQDQAPGRKVAAISGSDAVFSDMPPVLAGDLRSAGPVMVKADFDVVTIEEAERRLRSWLTGMPVASVYFWDSIAAMDDDLVETHTRLIADLAAAVADIGLAP